MPGDCVHHSQPMFPSHTLLRTGIHRESARLSRSLFHPSVLRIHSTSRHSEPLITAHFEINFLRSRFGGLKRWPER